MAVEYGFVDIIPFLLAYPSINVNAISVLDHNYLIKFLFVF